jgi:hypothetical protein
MTVRQRSWSIGAIGLLLLSATYAGAAVFLVRLRASRAQLQEFQSWFDPLFFEYNVLLLLIAQLLVPAVTLMYVRRMKGEKERRLRRGLPDALWRANEADILGRLDGHFRLGNYFGSVALVSIVITMGASIILLLKPVVSLPAAATGGRAGLDYTLGANFLLMGPVIGLAPGSDVFNQRVLLSLTAFQFGFLGGFVYFIGQLVRSYFTLDLTPHTYVESSVRMVSASLLALVISFAFPLDSLCTAGTVCAYHALPLVAFALGYFPNRAILFIEQTAARLLAYQVSHYAATPLSELPGMSLAHEVMLNREGLDNVENMSQADAIDLAIRTGFSYRQLVQWTGQAWLRLHFGADYDAFFRETGITTRGEFKDVVDTYAGQPAPGTPPRGPEAAVAQLITRDDPPTRAKVLAVYALAASYEPHMTSGLVPSA